MTVRDRLAKLERAAPGVDAHASHQAFVAFYGPWIADVLANAEASTAPIDDAWLARFKAECVVAARTLAA